MQTLSTLTTLNFRLIQQKVRKTLKKYKTDMKNFSILGSKTPKNDILTLNYGLTSSFNKLSTWRATKRG